MAKPRFKNQVKHYASSIFRGTLTKFEKKCFGWHLASEDVVESDVHYETTTKGEVVSDTRWKATTTTRRKSTIIRHLYFSRVQPYTDDTAFRVVETIESFFSFFRRHTIITLILSILLSMIVTDMAFDEGILCLFVFGLQITAWTVSVILALVGKKMREQLQLNEKLEQQLLDAGVAPSDAQSFAYND